MSQSAEITLTGASTESLLKRIEDIRAWDNGKNYEIIVNVGGVGSKYDTIDNIEKAIKNDIAVYIGKNFDIKNKVFKTGGNDDIYVVDNPDNINYDENHFVKRRNSLTNFTPKKKKKKRVKKTHRKR